MGEGVGYCAVMSHESLRTLEGRAGELADGGIYVYDRIADDRIILEKPNDRMGIK